LLRNWCSRSPGARIFPNAACATALIDRVIHHADIITIEGQSYRRRVAEQNATERKAKTKR